MKALTSEGWVGLITLIINLVGAILNIVLDASWADGIPLILAILSAIGAFLVWFLGRQTVKTLRRLSG